MRKTIVIAVLALMVVPVYSVPFFHAFSLVGSNDADESDRRILQRYLRQAIQDIPDLAVDGHLGNTKVGNLKIPFEDLHAFNFEVTLVEITAGWFFIYAVVYPNIDTEEDDPVLGGGRLQAKSTWYYDERLRHTAEGIIAWLDIEILDPVREHFSN